METITQIDITNNTILGNQVSPFLIRELNKLKTTSDMLGVNFQEDSESVSIVEHEVEKLFKKQLMKPRGEMYQAAITFVTGL